jgi:aspartate ammonia-lyase
MPHPRARLESDPLGVKTLPADVYYGVQTARGRSRTFTSPASSCGSTPT